MPIVPMKQSVTITRKSGSDGWGGGNAEETFALRCRVDEKTEIVQNQFGEESVSSAQIMFDKLADVRYDDDIHYVDELGREIKRKPLRIEPVRHINNKAIITLVFL